MSSKCKTLSSNPITTKTANKKTPLFSEVLHIPLVQHHILLKANGNITRRDQRHGPVSTHVSPMQS
jgi:hypothetical protein